MRGSPGGTSFCCGMRLRRQLLRSNLSYDIEKGGFVRVKI